MSQGQKLLRLLAADVLCLVENVFLRIALAMFSMGVAIMGGACRLHRARERLDRSALP